MFGPRVPPAALTASSGQRELSTLNTSRGQQRRWDRQKFPRVLGEITPYLGTQPRATLPGSADKSKAGGLLVRKQHRVGDKAPALKGPERRRNVASRCLQGNSLQRKEKGQGNKYPNSAGPEDSSEKEFGIYGGEIFFF